MGTARTRVAPASGTTGRPLSSPKLRLAPSRGPDLAVPGAKHTTHNRASTHSPPHHTTPQPTTLCHIPQPYFSPPLLCLQPQCPEGVHPIDYAIFDEWLLPTIPWHERPISVLCTLRNSTMKASPYGGGRHRVFTWLSELKRQWQDPRMHIRPATGTGAGGCFDRCTTLLPSLIWLDYQHLFEHQELDVPLSRMVLNVRLPALAGEWTPQGGCMLQTCAVGKSRAPQSAPPPPKKNCQPLSYSPPQPTSTYTNVSRNRHGTGHLVLHDQPAFRTPPRSAAAPEVSPDGWGMGRR